jgi:hypothetical protein
MWQTTHKAVIAGLDKHAVWNAWADVNHWAEWDRDIDGAALKGKFVAGAEFTLHPKGGPRVRIELVRAEPLVGYTDLARFPLARMYGVHDMRETPRGLELTITIRVEGPLTWLWRKLVAQKVADEAPRQMASLATFAMRAATATSRT